MPRVPVKDTSYKSRDQFLVDVYAACQRAGLSAKSARLLTAHAAHSSGYGRKLYNFNLFGIKGAPAGACPTLQERPVDNFPNASAGGNGLDWGHDFSCLLSWEVVNGKTVRQRMAFRAFYDLVDCIETAINTLKGARYAKTWSYLLVGDVEYFSQLGRDGWYTDSIDSVYSSCVAILPKIDKAVKTLKPSDKVGVSGFVNVEVALAVVAVGAILYFLL